MDDPPAPPSRVDRFTLRGRSLRQHAARGTLINTAFLVAVSSLALLKGFVAVAFVSRDDYGVWGVLTISLGTLLFLKQVGISDKYVQQDDPDQERAFQLAFTLEAIFTGFFMVVLTAAVPVIALVYGERELLVPGLLMVLALPAYVLQSPQWIFYRRMEFARQRALQAVDPVIGFALTVGLCAAGAGYWGLLAGALAGSWGAALVSVWACPYRLRFRLDRAVVREYVGFSWPVLVAGGSGIVIAQGTVLAGEAKLGLAGAGAITLASSITQYADRVDQIVTQTLYPAIAAVKERTEVLFESFVKSNRLALMWGAPFGIALALFSSDLVSYAIGERWRPAVGLLQAFGVIAAVNHIGFNWSAFYRARGDTRPMATVAVLTTIVFCAVTLPLLLSDGLDGLALGMAIMVAASLAGRAYYLQRLFPGFHPLRHALRALAPTVPATAIVLALRALDWAHESEASTIAELALFVVVCAAATVMFERPLLREVAGYLRSRPREAV